MVSTALAAFTSLLILFGRPSQVTARETLRAVFGSERAAREWTTETLAKAHLDPERETVKSIAALRKAEPRLTLIAATHLVTNAR